MAFEEHDEDDDEDAERRENMSMIGVWNKKMIDDEVYGEVNEGNPLFSFLSHFGIRHRLVQVRETFCLFRASCKS